MKKRRAIMLVSALLLILFYFPALFQASILTDTMELPYKAYLHTGFASLCLWDWAYTPLTLMCFSGAMLLSAILAKVNPVQRWKRIMIDAAVGVYALPFFPLFFLNFRLSNPLLMFWLVLPILPILAILVRHIRAVQYGACVVSGGVLLWSVIVCVVNYLHGAYAFDYFAACMLIPTVMLLRALLCPNSRIASVVAVAITGWSAYIVSQEFSQEIIRLTKQWPKPNSVYQVLYYGIICALILSLICLIIDTVFVFLSHRKTAIPAVPGDPPALAEE